MASAISLGETDMAGSTESLRIEAPLPTRCAQNQASARFRKRPSPVYREESGSKSGGRLMAEAGADDRIDQAAKRLERAVSLLEQRLSRLNGEAQAGGLFDEDRAKLAAELDASRARERELAEAGEQASKALGRAIAEIRAALGEEDAA